MNDYLRLELMFCSKCNKHIYHRIYEDFRVCTDCKHIILSNNKEIIGKLYDEED
jgi:DNA-directed RNA polymerase subunit M/transcription elongation factor TFIIS